MPADVDVSQILREVDGDLAQAETALARTVAHMVTIMEKCGGNAITTRILDNARHDLANIQNRVQMLPLLRETLVKQAKNNTRAWKRA